MNEQKKTSFTMIWLLVLVLAFEAEAGNKSYRAYADLTELERSNRDISGGLPQDLVSDIHCMNSKTAKSFRSVLRLPPGHSAPPTIEGGGDAGSGCSVREAGDRSGVYVMELSLLEDCGVRECQEQGETWLCVLVRFPVLTGLMLPEDEVISIKCKPQDPRVVGNNAVTFKENKNLVEQRSPAVFTGGGHQFLSEIGLFRKLAGTELFAGRVKSGSSIELGERVQLRSIVRSGDGWKYSKLTDVIVHRVHEGKALEGDADMVQLVDRNGCRLNRYKTLAPIHPRTDDSNFLITNFDFRVFMFQEMKGGDSIMVTAKVQACVEKNDCAVRCPSFPDGRVRREAITTESVGQPDNSTTDNRTEESLGRTENWQEDIQIKVALPGELSGGMDTPLVGECRLYLIITLSTALTFCLLSACIVIIACYRKINESRIERKLGSVDGDGRSEDTSITSGSETGSGSSSGCPQHPSANPSAGDQNGGGAGYPAYYLIPCNTPGKQQPAANNRPVTVRSVKRRDKGKNLERRIGAAAAAAVMESESAASTETAQFSGGQGVTTARQQSQVMAAGEMPADGGFRQPASATGEMRRKTVHPTSSVPGINSAVGRMAGSPAILTAQRAALRPTGAGAGAGTNRDDRAVMV